MTERFGRIARPTFVTKKSSGTSQLAQFLKGVIRGTNGERVVLVGVDKDGEPVDVNDYCTMFIEKFPCEGFCWKGIDEPPLTDHVTILSPSLIASVCTEFGCGSFFYIDGIDAPQIAGLPYEDMKAAVLDQAFWFSRLNQNEAIGGEVKDARKKARDYKRKNSLKDTWEVTRHDPDELRLPTSEKFGFSKTKKKPKEPEKKPRKYFNSQSDEKMLNRIVDARRKKKENQSVD